MIKPNLAEIRKRVEAASPVGISERGGELFRYQLNRWHEEVAHEMMSHNEIVGRMKYRDDARFLSHARTDIPLLLDALDSAMKVIEAARKYAYLDWEPAMCPGHPNEMPGTSCLVLHQTPGPLNRALSAFDEATK